MAPENFQNWRVEYVYQDVILRVIQVEDLIHFVPGDERDLHALVLPCPCGPTVGDGRVVHKPWGDMPCKEAGCLGLMDLEG